MTTAAATPAGTERLIAEYVALAVEAHNAPTIAEQHDAERRAREFARRFGINEFDAEPRVLEAVFASMTDDELHAATNDPSRRIAARAELRRRAEVAEAQPADEIETFGAALEAQTDDEAAAEGWVAVEPVPVAELVLIDPRTPLADEHLADAEREVAVLEAESEVADRATPVADLDDRAVWVQFMIEDRALGGYDDDPNEPNDDRHGDLIAEVNRRFGPNATEFTAEHAVALHMSGDDLVRWARDSHEHLVAVATGRIVAPWQREDAFGVDNRSHPFGCPGCDLAVERAVEAAVAQNLTGATLDDGTGHVVTVSRDPHDVTPSMTPARDISADGSCGECSQVRPMSCICIAEHLADCEFADGTDRACSSCGVDR